MSLKNSNYSKKHNGNPRNKGYIYPIIKRIFDIVISSLCLLLILPLIIAVAVMIKCNSRGPVFFSTLRIGLMRKRFNLYKFRTMFTDAEGLLQDLLVHNEMDGPVFKIISDPRMTSVGKFLRRTSLDEIPQFWNVLMGDMSLVGPRPALPYEMDYIGKHSTDRFMVKPGITGLWQISGRTHYSYEGMLDADLQYCNHASLWLDLKIIIKTIFAAFQRQGVY